MKKLSFAIVLSILFSITAQSQLSYSEENLNKLSQEELSLYLIKAQKLKKTGGVIIVAGISTVGLGGLFISGGERTAYFGLDLILLGAATTMVVGIPVRLSGANRVRHVSGVWNSKYTASRFELAPCTLYNYQTNNIQPGVSLKLMF